VASLYITEFQASGNSESGAQLQVGMQPAVAMQKLSFTTSTQSAEFDDRTKYSQCHGGADQLRHRGAIGHGQLGG